MANVNLFSTAPKRFTPPADTTNAAGGRAYALTPKEALAQLAFTGCLNDTHYTHASDQLQTTLRMLDQVTTDYVAKLALASRQLGYMKDMPALLCAYLATKNLPLLKTIFPQVIDNAKMLRNFVQIIRSGAVGRKSLGTAPKSLVKRWLETRTPEQLFRDSIGQNPSLGDIIKMVHPRPDTPERAALYAYLIGKPYDASHLPDVVQDYETWKLQGYGDELPDVPFQMVTQNELTTTQWAMLSEKMTWTQLRMSLNTLARNDVFTLPEVTNSVAERLASPPNKGVFPYQLLTTYQNLAPAVPEVVANALQDAMEKVTANIPEIPGKVFVLVDVSGSMSCPVTGARGSATSKTSCRDVAALIASCILRTNKNTFVLPFATKVFNVRLNSRDTVMTNARTLAALPSGGTDISVGLRLINEIKADVDTVIIVSDNESWVQTQDNRTGTMAAWNALKVRNPRAKLVCIDLAPNTTTQAKNRDDVLNIGGFSDQVFDTVARFVMGNGSVDEWVKTIEATNPFTRAADVAVETED